MGVTCFVRVSRHRLSQLSAFLRTALWLPGHVSWSGQGLAGCDERITLVFGKLGAATWLGALGNAWMKVTRSLCLRNSHPFEEMDSIEESKEGQKVDVLTGYRTRHPQGSGHISSSL